MSNPPLPGEAPAPPAPPAATAATPAAPDPVRWQRVSALLDELMELDAPAREARLAALVAEDEALGTELADMLVKLDALAGSAFLAQPALPTPAGRRGDTVGAYTLVAEIGSGGMGSVWRARRTDGRYEGEVAIKFLRDGLLGRGAAARFAREGRILARLSHPHIARLLDAGLDPGGSDPYLVLELVEGQPLDQHCEAAALPFEARLRLMLDVMDAVAHAHARLILHRDLKPGNILVTAAGDVKLLDFGIAKLLDDTLAEATQLTRAGGAAFTAPYAAPEQLLGADVTTATDVHALGALLYLLLTGVHPSGLPASAPLAARLAQAGQAPPRMSQVLARQGGVDARRRAQALRGDLDVLVAKALAPAPEARYANAAELADDLRRHLAHTPIQARADSAAYRLAKFVRRHRVGVALGTVAGLALATGITVALLEGREARRQQAQAEGLIEFMIGDLRKQLQPVGKLDALDGVGTRALAYYAAQDTARLDADSLGRRSRALHLIGEIAEQRGRIDEAARFFDEAARSTAALLARRPDDGPRLFEHAQSVYWVGYIARRRGRLPEAEAAFRDYQRLARHLVQVQPQQPDWALEPAYAATNLGILLVERGEPDAALPAFQDVLRAYDQALPTHPELRTEVANTWGWVAKAQEARGDYAAALAAQGAKAQVLQPLPVTDREAAWMRANGRHETGRFQLIRGQVPAARQAEAEAVAQWDALLALDPANYDWLAESVAARLGLVEAQLAGGDAAGAQAQLGLASAGLARLLAAGGDKPHWQVNLQGHLRWLASLAAPQDAAATAALGHYLAEVAAREQAGTRLEADQRRMLALVGLQAGDRLAAAGDMAAARQRWAETLQRVKADAAAGQPPALATQALAAQRLGELQVLQAAADNLQGGSFRHPLLVPPLHLRAAGHPASVAGPT